jgi:lipopolysaccharide transport system ATP-binding protein
MSQLALKLENVSKLYRLGEVGTGTLAHDLNRWWAKMRGKEDPTLAVVGVNDREMIGGDYAWALRNINLEVEQGEILGIIGRNGAGKSTLLKLLSRVTAPTEGRIKIKGKIASLLEVGTGFHPELTGRENIFLNGAILGMTRIEVSSRLEEIVEFSGCQKFIDTPVKRYSSGMYVRLAFAVAAHLEPDILVVDEVLAVGDAEFQRKCIGKLKDVSGESGRTVLFVSHNMVSLRNLCPQSVLLDKGMLIKKAETGEIIDGYLNVNTNSSKLRRWTPTEDTVSQDVSVDEILVLDDKGDLDHPLWSGNEVRIEIRYQVKEPLRNLRVCVTLMNIEGVVICASSDYGYQEGLVRTPGSYISRCRIPANFLNIGMYLVKVDFELAREWNLVTDLLLSFEIDELSRNSLGPIIADKPPGLLHPDFVWTVFGPEKNV